jgi:diguanylate cyclase (GGDEF)-like protein/PAS domain S-box-containing protein
MTAYVEALRREGPGVAAFQMHKRAETRQVEESGDPPNRPAGAPPPTAEQQAFFLQALLDSLPDQVYFKDTDSRFVAVSQHLARRFGLSDPRQVLGKTDADFFTSEHAEEALRDEREIIRTGQPLVNFEEKETLPNGIIRWVSTTKMPLRDRDGRIIGTFGLSRDITERKRMEEQLVRRTFFDPLTQLPNRGLFLSRLEQLCAEAQRRRDGAASFAVIYLNVDRFQGINESLGHEVGDELLVQIARRLQGCLRDQDTLARLGGDEFALLLEGVRDLADAQRSVDALVAELGAPFAVGRTEVVSTVSIGIALGSGAYERAEHILRDADIALHRAKAQGPGERQIFDSTMRLQAVDRLQVELELRRAIERQELLVYYQPIVDLRARRVCGFESLVRWKHPTKGLVGPDLFMPAAERAGLMEPLGALVLEEVCRQVRSWEERYPGALPLRVSVNLSASQLRSPRLFEEVRRIVEGAGVRGDSIIVELTESAVMVDRAAASRVLAQLRGLGMKLHIDDFGTGYSSLGYLHTLPVDALKIDRSFVARLGSGDSAAEIVRAIVALAQALRLEVVAEGIETREQLAALRAVGCGFAQGFLFAHPLPAEEAERALTSPPPAL